MKPSRKRKGEKKQKGANTTLYIALGCGGLALVSLLAVCIIGGIGYQQGWFKGKTEPADRFVQDGKPKPILDDKAKPGDFKPTPGDLKGNPDLDKKKAEKPAGVVAVIPKNVTQEFKNKFDPNPSTLADVEKRLGAPGKRLAPEEVIPQVKDLMQIGQVAPTAVCYRWSSNRENLFLVFDGNVYAGVALLKSKGK